MGDSAGHAQKLSEKPSLGEEPILNLSEFHRSRTLRVIIRHVVDPRAHGIAPHLAGIIGLQHFGDRGEGLNAFVIADQFYLISLGIGHIERAPGASMGVRRFRLRVPTPAAKEGLPWRAIKVGDDIQQVLRKALQDREVVAIIADEKSVSAGAWKARLAVVDANAGANCILLVGLQTAVASAISVQDAQMKLAAMAPRLSAASRVDWFPADEPDVLKARLGERVVTLRMSMVKSDPARPVVNEVLVREALDNQGLTVGTRPSVNGPTGAKS